MQTQPYKQPPGPPAGLPPPPSPARAPEARSCSCWGLGLCLGRLEFLFGRHVKLGEDRKKVDFSCLFQESFFFFPSFFFSCLFRSKPDLAGSQAVPRSIFDSSRSCCS